MNQYACVDTTEKIFLLSVQEATTLGYGFADHNVYLNEAITTSTRTRKPTSYAIARGASWAGNSLGSWWLRSPIYSSENAMHFVDNKGADSRSHTNLVDKTDVGVVPALYIKLQ